MMQKYLTQKNAFSCVAIAVLNSRIWRRERVSYRRDYPGVCRKLGIVQDGPPRQSVTQQFKKFGYRQMAKPTLNKVDAELKRGNGILLGFPLFMPQGTTGHMMFIDARSRTQWHCTNSYGRCHRWINTSLFLLSPWPMVRAWVVEI